MAGLASSERLSQLLLPYLGPWLIALGSARQTCARRRLSGWHNRKLRWKQTRRERMLEQCYKQCFGQCFGQSLGSAPGSAPGSARGSA